MFWIAVLGGALSWMLVKLGAMSATAGFLSAALKSSLLLLLLVSVIAGIGAWVRRKA